MVLPSGVWEGGKEGGREGEVEKREGEERKKREREIEGGG